MNGGHFIRIDFFLKQIGIFKTRNFSKVWFEKKWVYLENRPVKASHIIQKGDKITIEFPEKKIYLKILQVPTGKSLPKIMRNKMAQVEQFPKDIERNET